MRLFLPGLLAVILTGCNGEQKLSPALLHAASIQPRSDLLMFDVRSGEAITWDDLLARIGEADAVIVGEQHDDAVGHKVQLAIVEDVMDRFPGSALAMEMLDRSEQAVVDDYLGDLIDREKFYELTASTRWRKIAQEYLDGEINKKKFRQRILTIGWPEWKFNYQPIIDAAKDGGGTVVAANAPWTRYTKLISTEGYDFDSMTPAQRSLIEIPEVPESGPYREKFWEVMVDRLEGEEPEEDEQAEDDSEAAHVELTDEQVGNMFYSQLSYDATMGDSIADALANGATKVVHLVGQFHSDFNGGTIMELKRRAPGVRVLSITMQKADATEVREEDADRADIVIYTGAREE